MKRFAINHTTSTMKVGTDGLLLGALAAVTAHHYRAGQILDVGTGTGLIALMMAQKVEEEGARILGIEKDHLSAIEALENVSGSPFSDCIEIVEGDYLTYTPRHSLDLIVSNPPFFSPTHHSPDLRRTLARHIGEMTPEVLIHKSAHDLPMDGLLMLIVPHELLPLYDQTAKKEGLSSLRKWHVHTTPSKPPKRVVLLYRKGTSTEPALETDITILREDGSYTEDYRTLLSPYMTIF